MMKGKPDRQIDPYRVFTINDNGNGLPFFVAKYDLAKKRKAPYEHDFIQINYVYSGRAIHIINGKEYEIIKGDIFIIPPRVPHNMVLKDDESAVIFEFEFTPEFINQNFHDMSEADVFVDFAYIKSFLVSQDLVKPRFNLVGSVQTAVESILHDVYTEYTKQNTGFELLIRAQLLRLLVIVGREFSQHLNASKTERTYKAQKECILNAVSYIEDNYFENLTADIVAKKFMLSPSYFSYLFKYFTSKTFTEYLTMIRIAKALELLVDTDKKIMTICYEVGFNNVNHFNRIFKREMSMSPNAYRAKKRQE